jgi:8-oxo-dGTP pyrophosphatase MutT (NUDIX family)
MMTQPNFDLNNGRDLHRVTTKVAIYTPSGSHAMVMHMYVGKEREMYGLPGGHIDTGEQPDETIVRELDEELGIKVSNLRHIDFFIHSNGKIVLSYTATLPHNTVITPSDPAKEIGVWLSRDEFDDIVIESNYRALVLDNWPKNTGFSGPISPAE